jgi:putative FmdB family regulatory protein
LLDIPREQWKKWAIITMPIYEFRCRKCHSLTSILSKSIAEPVVIKCSSCYSNDLAREISRFSYRKSNQAIWEEAGEPEQSCNLDYYKDPRNIGRWIEKRCKQMDFDIPSSVNEKIKAAREGELPASLQDIA